MRISQIGWRRGALAVAVSAAVAALAAGALPGSAGAAPSGAGSASAGTHAAPWDWPSGGRTPDNTRSNPFEFKIGPRNVSKLAVKWTFTAHGDTSATPAVVGGAVYVPDWGGYLSKLDARTGAVIWSRPISDYNGIPGSISRVNPTVVGNRVYLGDQNAPNGGAGAHLLAVDATTGDLVWNATVDNHFAAILTGSPTVFGGVVYQGVASKEHGLAANPAYPCCTFRGSVNAFDASTGTLLWKTYTVPDNGGQPGYAGASVWNAPTIDARTHTLFVGTGNNYSMPQDVYNCEATGAPAGDCMSEDNHVDSVLALDMRTGRIKWSVRDDRYDTWTVACVPGQAPKNCPPFPGEDFDFGGSGTQLLHIPGPHGQPRTVIGAGQKAGVYWLLDANTGAVVWKTQVAPGGLHGGMEWGTATDGRRIYVSNANSNHVTYTLPDGTTTSNGVFAALDARTGRILWQTADPNNDETMGPVTFANGVMYAGSMSNHMYAIDGATGKIKWDFTAAGSVNGGATIVNGTVYWGSGYHNRFLLRNPSTTFYAFSLNGQ
jgi:polyvinyl alcohol dehydrogenase (cytochrome)